jgi:hypothetical protein
MGEELVGRDLFDEDYLWFYDDMLEARSDGDDLRVSVPPRWG